MVGAVSVAGLVSCGFRTAVQGGRHSKPSTMSSSLLDLESASRVNAAAFTLVPGGGREIGETISNQTALRPMISTVGSGVALLAGSAFAATRNKTERSVF